MNDERKANDLYWNSERSVNSIADELGLSKGRLYDAVDPLPSGSPCPDCGTELVYPNRTARDRKNARCPSCGAEAKASARRGAARGPSGAKGSPSGETPFGDRLPSPTARILIGAAIGGAVGVLIVRRLRR